MNYIIRDKEAGNVIEQTLTIEKARNIVRIYEKQDYEDGTYTPDFYEIIEVSNAE